MKCWITDSAALLPPCRRVCGRCRGMATCSSATATTGTPSGTQSWEPPRPSWRQATTWTPSCSGEALNRTAFPLLSASTFYRNVNCASRVVFSSLGTNQQTLLCSISCHPWFANSYSSTCLLRCIGHPSILPALMPTLSLFDILRGRV